MILYIHAYNFLFSPMYLCGDISLWRPREMKVDLGFYRRDVKWKKSLHIENKSLFYRLCMLKSRETFEKNFLSVHSHLVD